MRTFIIGFVVFLLYAIPARWHYTCKIRNLCGDSTIVKNDIVSQKNDATRSLEDSILLATKVPNRKNDLSVMLGTSIVLENFDQFGFLPNSAKLNLTDNNKAFLKGIAEELKKNPEARLEIVGNYFDDEKVTSGTYDNLGLARAAAIRDYLMSEYEFKAQRFKLDYEQIERGDEIYLDRPVEYNMIVPNIKPNTKPKGKDDEVLVEASYTFERMTFSDINFEYNKAKFNPSNSFSIYADSVKKYLELNSEKSILIVGHADNRGTEETNRILGLRRANNVIIYLRDTKGIDLKRIDSDSKGENEPIVPNTTESNMRKNRRVEVIIK